MQITILYIVYKDILYIQLFGKEDEFLYALNP